MISDEIRHTIKTKCDIQESRIMTGMPIIKRERL